MEVDKSVRIHFLTLLIGFSQVYAWATTYYLPAAIVSTVARETHLPTLAIVGGFSWALLVGGLFAPKIGEWIEFEGGRRPLALGSFLMGAGLLLIAQTNGWLIWYCGWTFIGLGMAMGLFTATFAAIGRLFGQAAKGIIIRITLISGFATLVWPLTTYLMDHVGWRLMVVFYAIPHILFWAPMYYFNVPHWVPEHGSETTSDHRVAPENVKLVFYLLACFSILRAIVGTAVSVDIITLFVGLGLTITAAAVVASLIGPSQIAGRIIELIIGKNFDPVHTSLFWTAVLPFGILVLVLAGSSAAPFFAVAYGMSNGVLSITMGILPMILFGARGYAAMLGRLALPMLIAQAATPLLVDPMIANWHASYIFMVAGCLGLAALFCLFMLMIVAKRTPQPIKMMGGAENGST